MKTKQLISRFQLIGCPKGRLQLAKGSALIEEVKSSQVKSSQVKEKRKS